MVLADIAVYVTDKISSEDITIEEYVTTDSLLQNKRGRCEAQNLPPVACSLTHFEEGDILVANIRPYLKKVWLADSEGGCSADVLVFRAKEGHSSEYLHAVLLQDAFFSYAMKGNKGSKMPRGDKDQIMRFPIQQVSPSDELRIGNIIHSINRKIQLNSEINHYLEAMAKQLYDYWFVQFDFPDANGKPYKSSGGKMVWNDRLKREIPLGWDSMTIGEYAPCKGGYAFKSSSFCEGGIPVIKIGNIQEDYTLNMSDSQCISDFTNVSYFAHRYDLVIAMTGATIGKFAVSQREYLINQRVGRFDLGNNPISKLGYILNSLKQDYFREQIFQISGGCAQPNISSDQIDSIVILKPETSLLSEFNERCESLISQQSELLLQIEHLITLRNEILPLLMNGQIGIKQLNNDLANG